LKICKLFYSMKTLHKNLFKQPFFWTSICSCLALSILVALYSHAWVAPGANPNLNTNAAINFYNGNVGIGTAIPSQPFTVNSATDQGRIAISGASDSGYTYSGLYLNDSSADNNNNWALVHKNDQGQTTQDDFQIVRWITASPASNRVDLAIDSATGNVGIGTATPGTKLQVSGSAQTLFDAAGFYNTYAFNVGNVAETRINLGRIENGNLYPQGAIGATSMGDTDSTNGKLQFYTRDSSVLGSRMIIENSGDVGIGIPNPGQKLSVAGVIESTTGGIKFPDATIQTTAATASGNMSWPTSVKETTATHNGQFASSGNGYPSIETWIVSNGCSGYHVCMPWELTYAVGHLSSANLCGDGSCSGWYNGGISTYPPSGSYHIDDCDGWSSSSSARGAYIWSSYLTSDTTCNGANYVLCCK
jgi:hypothetical protein